MGERAERLFADCLVCNAERMPSQADDPLDLVGVRRDSQARTAIAALPVAVVPIAATRPCLSAISAETRKPRRDRALAAIGHVKARDLAVG